MTGTQFKSLTGNSTKLILPRPTSVQIGLFDAKVVVLSGWLRPEKAQNSNFCDPPTNEQQPPRSIQASAGSLGPCGFQPFQPLKQAEDTGLLYLFSRKNLKFYFIGLRRGGNLRFEYQIVFVVGIIFTPRLFFNRGKNCWRLVVCDGKK